MPDSFEARQAGEKLKDEKGRGQSSGDKKGEGIPIERSQTTWLFLCNARVVGSTYKYATTQAEIRGTEKRKIKKKEIRRFCWQQTARQG